ncbi:DNA repair protein RAD51 homolog 3 [Scophthalmus maximus]|uniref:DNA repair protein RAD51 homolog 3 n=1 Tax=Scophthalmus maximus TaxID=52904 RepID=UPI001FA883BF|nr:DNA repair protein RAD51 homolog 3 [Scophthalmus maximus]
MQRPVSSFSLSPGVKVKLASAGFRVTADLLHLSPPQLSREAGLSQQEALEVLQAVRSDGGGGASMSALELLQKEGELRSIVTFSSHLDAALGGGVPVGKSTEICGTPGVGKTQLCLQLVVDVQVPQCFGGVEGQAIYIDTEGSFLLQRVVDVAAAAVRHCSLLVEDEEQRVAMTTFTVETILSNIFLVRCHDYVELLAELHLLPDFLTGHPKARLLVIDSVALPFRRFEDLSQRTRVLYGLAQQLAAIATRHLVAVVLTNQMTTRLRGNQSQLVPALGESWGHAPTIRLLLQWSGSQRLATVFKSPSHADATIQYQITSDGFRDSDQSACSQPGTSC